MSTNDCGCYSLQTWCIPGTFIFNLLGGALFGTYTGFALCVVVNDENNNTPIDEYIWCNYLLLRLKSLPG